MGLKVAYSIFASLATCNALGTSPSHGKTIAQKIASQLSKDKGHKGQNLEVSCKLRVYFTNGVLSQRLVGLLSTEPSKDSQALTLLPGLNAADEI